MIRCVQLLKRASVAFWDILTVSKGHDSSHCVLRGGTLFCAHCQFVSNVHIYAVNIYIKIYRDI